MASWLPARAAPFYSYQECVELELHQQIYWERFTWYSRYRYCCLCQEDMREDGLEVWRLHEEPKFYRPKELSKQLFLYDHHEDDSAYIADDL